MNRDIVFVHPRQMGDIIRGAHIAKLLKQKYKDEWGETPLLYFYTIPMYMEMLEECAPWIDIVLDPGNMIQDIAFRKRTKDSLAEEYDNTDILLFNKITELHTDAICFRPHFNYSDEFRNVEYGENYVYRVFAYSCLPQLKESDTEFLLSLNRQKYMRHRKDGFKIIYHTDFLSHLDFKYVKSHLPKDIEFSELNVEKNLVENIHEIAASDICLTKYGGVATISAAVRTPSICIPKPESSLWAHPEYSHKHDFHKTIYPKEHCDKIHERLQPCMVITKDTYLSFDEKKCPKDFKLEKSDHADFFHCWRTIDEEQVIESLKESISLLREKTHEIHKNKLGELCI